jgi:hypothetical protein
MFNEIQPKLRIRLYSLSLPIRLFCGMFSRVVSNTATVALRVIKATKREPGAWRHNWATCHWGNYRPCPAGWGLDAKLKTLLCRKIIVTISKEVKTG